MGWRAVSATHAWLLILALSACSPRSAFAQAEEEPVANSEASGLRFFGYLSGAVVGGSLSLALSAGVFALGIELTRHAPYREDPSDAPSDCVGRCVGDRIFFLGFVALPLSISAVIGGTALGAYGAGRWMDGDGRVGTTLLGIGLGGLAQAGVIAVVLSSELERGDTMRLVFGSTLLTVAGGVIGYLLGEPPSKSSATARWTPLAALDPAGGGYIGARLAF